MSNSLSFVNGRGMSCMSKAQVSRGPPDIAMRPVRRVYLIQAMMVHKDS